MECLCYIMNDDDERHALNQVAKWDWGFESQRSYGRLYRRGTEPLLGPISPRKTSEGTRCSP